MRVDKKFVVSLMVSITFLILISIVSNIEPDSEMFLVLYLFFPGILIALIFLFVLSRFLFGMIYTMIYSTVNYLMVFIIIPIIADWLLEIRTCESLKMSVFITNLETFLPMFLTNLIAYTSVYIIGQFFVKVILPNDNEK